ICEEQHNRWLWDKSGLMKAGFADQDLPNVIFPTIIGMPKYEVVSMGHIFIYYYMLIKVLIVWFALANITNRMRCHSRK
uniref:Uncharacterized protein n=1 Tax=Mola mola TaxID=94237 RepID=A0A3Q3XBU7_MOLML